MPYDDEQLDLPDPLGLVTLSPRAVDALARLLASVPDDVDGPRSEPVYQRPNT